MTELVGQLGLCVSRHKFYVAIEVLGLGLFLGPDKISSIAIGLGCMVSRPGLLGRDRARLRGVS